MKALTLACCFAVTGCLSSLHEDVQKCLVFEQQIQSEAIQLKALGDELIPELGAEKRVEARAKLADAYSKLSAALAAKDAILNSALDATDSSVKLGKLALDVVDAIDEIVNLLKLFGVNTAKIESVETRAHDLRAAAVKL